MIEILTTASPLYLVILINTAAWFVFHMLGAGLASRLPIRLFHYHTWLYKTRGWEQKGVLYQKLFRIRSWKKYLPDGAAMFRGGFPKKHILPGQQREYYQVFIKETCRAELTHWIVFLAAPLFFLWNDWLIAIWMIPYAAASNAPCILAQRYNRPRIELYSSLLRNGGKKEL